MKKLILMFSCLIFGGLTAQNTDVMKNTEVKVIRDTINGQIIERSIKTVTTKKQPVMTNPEDAGEINGDRIFPPIKVTKTYYIDSDNDPFYEQVNLIKYYEIGDIRYAFKSSDSGFSISTFNKKNREKQNGRATRTLSSPYYFVSMPGLNGVGYFDENNTFVIEYVDNKTNTMKIIEFTEK